MSNSTMQLARRIWVPAVAAALCVGVAVADDFSLNWFTTAGGGATFSTGGDFSLGATIGQPAADALAGGDFTLQGGFWAGAAACGCATDANFDGKSDGRDIAQFVQCVIAPAGECYCADMDADSQITVADISEFVTGLLSAAECP